MILRLRYGLTGYLRVSVQGSVPERLVNLCAQEGIPLWDLRATGTGIEASIPVEALWDLRRLRRRAGVRIRILERHGLPFRVRAFRPLRVGLLLAAGALLALFVLSQFVWFFEVRGAERVDPGEILRVAAELGLRPGAYRPALDGDRITRDLVLRLPVLSWASLRFFGSKVIIEVAEKAPPPPAQQTAPGDIVARRAGVIEQIVVVQGEAAVRRGDTVRAGDVLIRGELEIPVPPGSEGGAAPQRQAVRARGRVLARTWYSAYAEAERVKRIASRTGRSATVLMLRAGGVRMRLAGPSRPPFRRFEVEERSFAIFRWRDGPGFVEIVRARYHELHVHELSLSRDEAVREAELYLKAKLMEQIGLGARIVDARSEVVLERPDRVGVRMVVECVEDIGRFEPLSGDPPAGEPGSLPGP